MNKYIKQRSGESETVSTKKSSVEAVWRRLIREFLKNTEQFFKIPTRAGERIAVTKAADTSPDKTRDTVTESTGSFMLGSTPSRARSIYASVDRIASPPTPAILPAYQFVDFAEGPDFSSWRQVRIIPALDENGPRFALQQPFQNTPDEIVSEYFPDMWRDASPTLAMRNNDRAIRAYSSGSLCIGKTIKTKKYLRSVQGIRVIDEIDEFGNAVRRIQE